MDANIKIVIESSAAESGGQRAVRSLNRIRDAAKSSQREIERNNSSFEALSRATRLVDGPLGGVAARFQTLGAILKENGKGAAALTLGFAGVVFGLKQLITTGDKYVQVLGRIAVTARTIGDVKAVTKELVDISARSGARLEDVASVFQRIAGAAKDLGLRQADILKFTDAVAKAGRVSGASGQALAAGLLQFGQALSAGTVRAEEFNSILENLPFLAQKIAEGFGTKFAGSVQKLRNAVLQGTVSSKELAAAFISQIAAIEEEFKRLPRTVGQAFNNLQVKFGTLLATAGPTKALFAAISTAIDTLADSLGIIANVIQTGFLVALGLALRNLGSFLLILRKAEGSFGTIRGLFKEFPILMGAYVVAVRAATAATLAFNTAITTNPLVFIAKAALTAGLAIYSFSEQIEESAAKGNRFAQFLEKIVGLFDAIVFGIKAAGTALGRFYDLGAFALDYTSAGRRGDSVGKTKAVADFKAKGIVAGMDVGGGLKFQKQSAEYLELQEAASVRLRQEAFDRLAAEKALAEELSKQEKSLQKNIGNYELAAAQAQRLYKASLISSEAKEAEERNIKVQNALLQEQDKIGRKLSKTEIDRIRFAINATEEYATALDKLEEKRQEQVKTLERLNDSIQEGLEGAIRSALDNSKNPLEGFLEFMEESFKNSFAKIGAAIINQGIVSKVVAAGAAAFGFGDAAQSVFPSAFAGGSPVGGGGFGGIFSSLLGGLTSPLISPGAAFDIGGLFGLSGSSVDFLQSGLSGFTGLSTLAGFGGNFLGNAIFGGNRGAGASIGGTLGGIGGAFFGGPIGSAIGSFLGNAIGGLFGGKPSDKTQTGKLDLSSGEILSRTGLTGSKFSQENFDAVTNLSSVVAQITGFIAGPGGIADTLDLIVGNREGLRYQFAGGELKGFGQDTGAFIKALSEDLVRRAPQVSESITIALKKIDFSDTEQALKDLEFAAKFDSLFETKARFTALEQQLRDLDVVLQQSVEKARQLGLDEKKLYEGRDKAIGQLRKDFDKGIANSILQITNPSAAELQNLEYKYIEIRRNAIALGADLAQVENLYALERQQILEQSLEAQRQTIKDKLEATLRDIQSLRDRLALDSNLSGTNRFGRAQEADRQVAALQTRIASGDETALADLERISTSTLQAQLDYYGPTQEYLSRLELIYKLLDDAEDLAKSQASLDQQMLDQQMQQTQFLAQIAAQKSADLLKAVSIPGASLVRSTENPALLSGTNKQTGLSELLTRQLKYTAADGQFQFNSAQTFAEFLKSLEPGTAAKIITRYNNLVESLGGTPQVFGKGTGSGTYQGMAIVGEKGPELLNFDKPVQVFNNKTTTGMLSSNDNARVVEQLDLYRRQSEKETQALLAQVAQVVGAVKELTDRVELIARAD